VTRPWQTPSGPPAYICSFCGSERVVTERVGARFEKVRVRCLRCDHRAVVRPYGSDPHEAIRIKQRQDRAAATKARMAETSRRKQAIAAWKRRHGLRRG